MRGVWALPLAAAAVLALARLARGRPALRRLLPPSALAIVVASLLASFEGPLPKMAWLALLIPVLVLAVRLSVLVFRGVFARSQGAAPPPLLESLVSVALYLLGFGGVLHRFFGFELTPFLATSAVVGAVVGLALQETLGNLFSGIALHAESLFRVGDFVRAGDSEGRVEQISWRATSLRTIDGDTLTIPNNDLSRRPILNYSFPHGVHTRTLILGVSAEAPPSRVFSVLSHLLAQIPGLAGSQVRIAAYSDSAIQYEIRYPVASREDYPRLEGEILRLAWYHFRRHRIRIPSPVRDVYLHEVEKKEGSDSHALRALRGIDLFEPLSDEELALAASRTNHLHYAQGETILEEGSPGDSFFVVSRGSVEVFQGNAGLRRSLGRLVEGQFFGEMALLTGAPRSATIVAASDVDLFVIDRQGFEEVLVGNPAVAEDISQILAERKDALSRPLLEPQEGEKAPGELKLRILDRIRSYFGL